MELEARVAGTLLGTAVGDALGLAAEGMSASAIVRRWGRLDRYRLLGRTGFVSDDTELAALVAQSLARAPGDPDGCARAFRRALVGWFWRLPFGIGLATLRACLRASLGLDPSGVASAGNGAAMRSPVLGAAHPDDPERRRAFAEAVARVTHTDERAVAGARFAAEVAALGPGAPPEAAGEPSLVAALERAAELARGGAATARAAPILGTGGFVLQTVPFAWFCFLRHRGAGAILEAVNAGGDTDTTGALVGAWVGAQGGEATLPRHLVDGLADGPFGPTHLRALAAALARGGPPPRYSATRALARNLALYPVVLAHGLRRLLP